MNMLLFQWAMETNPQQQRCAADKKGESAVTHLAAALFFTLSLLAAAVAIHVTVRLYWEDILAALRGELGRDVRQPATAARVYAPRPRVAS